MPKKKKQPRKPNRGSGPTGPPTRHVPPGWTPEVLGGLTQVGVSRAFSAVPDEAWGRLQAEFLESNRICCDCGGAWDLDSANEEEGETFGGQHVISIAVVCSKWDEDDASGREPVPHPLTGGIGQHEITLT